MVRSGKYKTTLLIAATVQIILLQLSDVQAGPRYEFCVYRTTATAQEKFGVAYNIGDADPGMEALRAYAMATYNVAGTTSISAGTYDPNQCGSFRDDTTINVNSDQVAKAGEALLRGDIPGAVVILSGQAIGVGTTVGQKIIEGAKTVLKVFGIHL